MMHPLRIALLVMFLPAVAAAMGTESFGNAPVPAQKDWRPGVVDAVNLPTRVYSRWVNGNESFYFQGGAAELNAALAKFAAIAAEEREVILRPGPGETRSFGGKPVSFDWEVHVPSGIYLARAGKEKHSRVFAKHATLSVYPRKGGIDLGQVKFPAGVRVIGLDQLRDRYREGFASDEPELRGMALTFLAELTPLASDVVPILASGLEDRNEYVRRSAAGALSQQGARARDATDALKRAIEAEKEDPVRESLRQALGAVEAASPDTVAQGLEDAAWAKELDAIRKLVEKLRKGSKR
jgi:hypothetical protein